MQAEEVPLAEVCFITKVTCQTNMFPGIWHNHSHHRAAAKVHYLRARDQHTQYLPGISTLYLDCQSDRILINLIILKQKRENMLKQNINGYLR